MLLRRCYLSPLLIFLCFVLTHSVAAQEIRVQLLERASPRQVVIGAKEGEVQLFAGDFADPLTTMTAGEVAIVSRASNQLHVKIGEMKLYAKSLRVEPGSSGIFSVAVREGRELAEERSYFGRLVVVPDPNGWELRLTNEVDLEEYVAGVVTSEYGLDDLEGSKAMAVVARTYAISRLLNEEGRGLSDHTLSQVYRGQAEVTPLARQAARETAGEVVTYNGSPIEAVYSSSSGGRTANNEDVWDAEPLPYLRGKHDPYDTASPHARWRARLSRADLLGRLSTTFQVNVDGFLVGDRSEDGRVETIELLIADGDRREISANAFRLAAINEFGPRSLRSTQFDVRREGDVYVFEGRGYGHGVGLSQWGAHEMANQGKSYRDILQFYYAGVQIGAYDGTESAAHRDPKLASRSEVDRTAEPEGELDSQTNVEAEAAPAVGREAQTEVVQKPEANLRPWAGAEVRPDAGAEIGGEAADDRREDDSQRESGSRSTKRIGW